ncbi:hypothetical protein BC936DRAFT_142172, partial [Jimgerdemannia flammicorona]
MLLHELGYTIREIASREKVPVSTVGSICQRISKTQNYQDKPRSGRPRIFSKRSERKITRLITLGKFQTAVEIQSNLMANDNIKVS